ncbi:MAG: hypothetical protein ACM3X0_09130 [Bacteroidota bacterium]
MSRDMTRVLPPGTYHLGDPSQILNRRDYELMVAAIPDSYTASGAGLCTVRGHILGVFSTGRGNGAYTARGAGQTHHIEVSSGVITLIPQELWDASRARHATTIIEAPNGFQTRRSDQGLRISGFIRCQGRDVSPLTVSFDDPAPHSES